MWEEILDNIGPICVPLIVAIIGYLATIATKFINVKKNEIINKTTNENIQLYVNLASDTVINVVQTLNSTMVDELKKANADGKLTKEEIDEIKNLALTMVLTMLTDEVKEGLSQVFGDLDTYLSSLIESTVYSIKNKLK